MRVVIAEDLALLREGLVALLRENDIDVVAQVEDGPGLLRAIAAFERPSAISASTSRSRALSAPSASREPTLGASISLTTCRSSTVPPPATRCIASRNALTSPTRSLSR